MEVENEYLIHLHTFKGFASDQELVFLHSILIGGSRVE